MTTPGQQIKMGTRVRVRAPSPALVLIRDTGTIVRPDEWADYYIVRLDHPAISRLDDGRTKELTEIVEDIENLDIIAPE